MSSEAFTSPGAHEPWHSPTGEDSARQLAGLGLTPTLLMAAVRSGVFAAQHITAFHPVTARGIYQWSETVASLRQAVAELDWVASDPQNSPRVLSPDRRTSIMVAGGNAATGSRENAPQLARRRGPSTCQAVQVNGQQAFDIRLELPRLDTSSPSTWMLLYHWAQDRPVIRAELSLPVQVVDGQVSLWRQRILLPEQDLTAFAIEENPAGPQDDVDFGVVELT